MIDWNKRKEEIRLILSECLSLSFKIDVIITQEQSMFKQLEEDKEKDLSECLLIQRLQFADKIKQFESDKAELLEALEAIKEEIDDDCISSALMIINHILKIEESK